MLFGAFLDAADCDHNSAVTLMFRMSNFTWRRNTVIIARSSLVMLRPKYAVMPPSSGCKACQIKNLFFKLRHKFFEVLFEEILKPFDVGVAVQDNLELFWDHFGYEFNVSEVMVIEKLP